MNERYLSNWARKKRNKCHNEIEQMRIKLQLSCKHDEVAEADYVAASSFSYAKPPFRVCKQCGFAEEGWSCGYHILKEAHTTVSRHEGVQLMEGGIHPNANFVRVGDCTNIETLYRWAVRGKDGEEG